MKVACLSNSMHLATFCTLKVKKGSRFKCSYNFTAEMNSLLKDLYVEICAFKTSYNFLTNQICGYNR